MPTSLDLNLGVVGATGRLGSSIVILAKQRGARVVLRASKSHGWMIEETPDVVVDVSHSSALPEIINYCTKHEVPLVCATSHLSESDEAQLLPLSERVAVVRAPNLSFGHHLQTLALAAIGQCLAKHARDVEVRVVDRHPAHKRARPSTTAVQLGRLWQNFGSAPIIEALRYGLAVSDHQVGWQFGGEELVVDHRVTALDAAANGALAAISWVVKRPKGLGGMHDVYS